MWWFKVGSKPQSSYSHQRVSASLSVVRGNVRSLCTALIVLVFLLVISSIASAFVGSIQSTGRSIVVGEQSRSKSCWESCREKCVCEFPDRLCGLLVTYPKLWVSTQGPVRKLQLLLLWWFVIGKETLNVWWPRDMLWVLFDLLIDVNLLWAFGLNWSAAAHLIHTQIFFTLLKYEITAYKVYWDMDSNSSISL